MDSNVKLSPSSSNNHPSASRAKSPTSGAGSSTGMTWSGSETPIMSAIVQQAHDQQVADGNTVQPRPSPTQPFGEYVATSMFLGDRSPIGLVAACAATLYLTRENPKLLETLVDVFATEFPVHKRDIITRFQGIAERKRIRLESTKARTCVAAAAALSPSGSSSALDEGESRGFHYHEDPVVSSTVPPVTLTTAPSSPAVVLVGRAHQQHHHHNHANDEEIIHNASLEEDERASTKSPDGDEGHVSMGPKKRTLLPRDPSVATSGTPSTITGSSNDPPSVNRTTSYQLVDETGVNRTTSYQLADSPSHHFDPHHQPPPPPALTLMPDDAGSSSQQQVTATASSHLPPAAEQHPPRPILSREVADVHDKVGLNDDVVTLARCLQHRRESSSPACSGGDGHSGPSSPTNASSHSTIQPLFRERTCDLLANPEMISNFFFTMVQGLVNLYFSYNWDVVDDVLQINQEYLRYVEEKLIPRVLKWVRTKDPALAARGLEEYENQRASNKKSTSSNGPAKANPLKAETSAMTDDHPATAEWLDFHGSTDSLTVGEMDSRATSQLWQQPSSSSSVFFSGKESAQLGDVIPSTEGDDQLLSVTPPLREEKTSKEDGSTSSGIIGGDASTMPFKFVTSDNVSEFLYLARDSPQRPLVLFFHVPFSQPSCTMWDVLSTVQRRCADSPTAPIIGLVQGVTEVELADTFTVTWYPTVILIPSGNEHHYVQVLSLIDRCTAATHRQQLHQAYDDIRMNCLAASSHEFEEDIPTSSTSPRGEAAPKHFPGFPCGQQFDSEDEAELEAAHISSDNNNGGGATTTATRRSVTPPSVSTSRCCERANEIQQEMSLLESIVGLRGTTPSRSRSPARDISTALTQEHHGEGVIFFRFPEKGIVMTDPVMEWIKGEGKVEAKQRKVKAWITRLVALTAQMKFKPMRQLHSAVVMLRRLQGSGTKENGGNHLIIKDDGQIEFEATSKAHTSAEDPPFFIFLGGGMAAGKTTAATALTRSEWWEAHKDQVVVVDADTFKMADPIRKTKPSDLHEQSTKYAEKLLVTALNQGRSVIFDGTMMWAPFVEQTAAMVREAHTHYFSMGPGFDEKLNIEQYWERGNARSVPLEVPYHILFLAITVEPHEAVPRGILRGVTTGRTVPIRSQLRSFRLFSEGFERYASLCDEVTLYNNNIRVDLEQGQLPPRILHKDSKDQEIVVEDAQAYENFRRHRTINDRATCCDEIYHPAPAATTPTPADGFGRRASFSSSFTTSTPPKASKPFSSSGSYSSVKL